MEISPPVNRAPVPSGSLAAQTLAVGQQVAVDVSPYFEDPDGDALAYAAASSDRDMATATMGGSELRVTGLAPGPVSVTVTASDPGQPFDAAELRGYGAAAGRGLRTLHTPRTLHTLRTPAHHPPAWPDGRSRTATSAQR